MAKAIADANNPQDNLVLDRETMDRMRSFSCVYHSSEDTLFFRPDNPQPATSFDWNGDLWFRIDPETNELVGLEIENFESIFLKKYPELSPTWKEFKPFCTHWPKSKLNDNMWESFVRIILDFLSGLFENNPQQLVLKESPA